MRLKGAYYRLAAVPHRSDINAPPGPYSPRKIAEDQIRTILGLAPGKPVGHDLIGWTHLLIATRNAAPLAPFSPLFEQALRDHIKNAALCWIEILRYRNNKPYNEELDAVATAARWLKRNYRALWS